MSLPDRIIVADWFEKEVKPVAGDSFKEGFVLVRKDGTKFVDDDGELSSGMTGYVEIYDSVEAAEKDLEAWADPPESELWKVMRVGIMVRITDV